MRPLSDIMGANKGPPPNAIVDAKAAFGEFVGMTIFIFLALSGVQGDLEAPTGIAHDLGITPSQIQSIALSFGVGVTVALFICGPISGGVLNPAILLSLMISGNINWLRGIFYFIAQMAGAILGAYFSNFVTAHELQGVNLLNPGFNYAQGFFAECLLTCCLCLTVLFVIVDKTSLADFAPFVVGTALFMCHMIGAPIDGTSVNPARSFAASVVTGKWANHWIFWFGPLIGAVFAAMIYIGCKMLENKSQSEILINDANQMDIAEGKGPNKAVMAETGMANHNRNNYETNPGNPPENAYSNLQENGIYRSNDAANGTGNDIYNTRQTQRNTVDPNINDPDYNNDPSYISNNPRKDGYHDGNNV